MSKYAYVAAHPDMPGYYAVASADPKYIKDIGTDIKEWEKDGAIVSLVTVEEARDGMQKYWDYKKAKEAALCRCDKGIPNCPEHDTEFTA